MKKLLSIILIFTLSLTFLSCGTLSQDKVSEDNEGAVAADKSASSKDLTEGTYPLTISMTGGTGKASIASPATLTVADGSMTVTLVWSSVYYDYMIVDDTYYYNENEGGNSTFTIPLTSIDEPLTVIADTTAMSTPHEIEYVLTFELAESTASSAFSEENKTGTLEVKYASQFTIDEYGDNYLITIGGSDKYLVVPAGGLVPGALPSDVTVLQQPLDKTYLVSTSAMDLVRAADALDMIAFSGTKASDWYIKEAAEAMQAGKITYAGKYSAPDYELILSGGCNLAIENTMISHSPEVKEKLEELNIPVLVERSSYESHPLGRLEWILVYGVLFDKLDAAKAYLDSELAAVEDLLNQQPTGKSIAFFAVNSTGMITVRKPGDYIAKAIELSGGTYALKDALVEEENALSTMNMQMEDFYLAAKDADILIYNATIEGQLKTMDDLLDKNSLFSDFKAVQSGNVYCTGKNFFQETTGIAEFMVDLNNALNEKNVDFTYLQKLK